MDQEEISRSLHDIEEGLTVNLGSTSPGTKRWASSVRERLDILRQKVDMFDKSSSDSDRIVEQDHNENEEQEEILEDNSGEDEKEKLVRARRNFLIDSMEKGRVTIREFVSLLVGNKDGISKGEREDNAISWLLRRFKLYGRAEWREVLKNLEGTRKTYPMSQDVSRSLRKNNQEDRIVSVHEALGRQDDRTTILVEHIISLSAIIEFSWGYEECTKGKGGRKRQQMIMKRLFQREPEFKEKFEGLTEEECDLVLKELNDEFTAFHKRMAQITRARNRLLWVYKEYGMGVFLDPFWNLANNRTHRRTKEFMEVLQSVLHRIPAHQYNPRWSGLTDDQENAFHIVVWILAEKAPEFVRDFVDLVNRRPCTIIAIRDGVTEGSFGDLEPLEYEREEYEEYNSD
ncbi:hypothetical protein VKT23_004363 [Stygiomarasmius scandens]|uniref:Uncharacterized protein n=1 Tax=Marasmiellus scandens TaxID=2682957 RepID=A0ABR1JWT0_9AGAR